MARINLEVTMANIYEYQFPDPFGRLESRFIYTMNGTDGKQYVWKTAKGMAVRVESTKGDGMEYDSREGKWYNYPLIRQGDIIKITASVKGESEYKGHPQTELMRVKVVERVYSCYEDKVVKRKEDQLLSLKGEDFIWREMPYKQYKEHYNDCETVVDSFNDHEGQRPATIDVIIREGRLKASGVRGGHYSGYEFFFTDNGEKCRVCYRAISEETALRRLLKEFPEAQDITPGQIFDYRAGSEFARDHFW